MYSSAPSMELSDDQSRPASDSGNNVDTPQHPTYMIDAPQENGSFFAEWFKVVDPNAPILEDQYFGRSGWALEPDNFESEEQLDSHLKSDHVLAESSGSDDPFKLSLEGFGDEESEASDISDISELGDLNPITMIRTASDWSKMPPLLPALTEEKATVTDLEPLSLNRQMSDWSEMPAMLPPLPLEPALSIPEITSKASTSDFVYVVPQVAQLPQSEWNTNPPVDVEDLHDSVIPYLFWIICQTALVVNSYQQPAPAFFPMAQASGLSVGQMVPTTYQAQPLYHLPCIVLGSTQLSFV